MKKIFFLAVVCLLLPLVLTAGGKELATFSPANPAIGSTITVTYNAAHTSATLRGVSSVTLEALVMREESTPLLVETPMKLDLNTWSCSFRLSDKSARFILYRFVNGDKTDDNGENVWTAYVTGKNRTPLRSSHFFASQVWRSGGYRDFRHVKEMDRAGKEIEKERSLYPDNLQAALYHWNMMLREEPGDETKTRIRTQLEALYGKVMSDEESVSSLLPWFEKTDQNDRAETIRKEALDRNPAGKIAESIRLREIYAERNPDKRLELLGKFLQDFTPDEKTMENTASIRLNAYIQTKQYDRAASELAGMEKPSGSMYNSLAWPLIEKGEELSKAVSWARKGIDIIRAEKASDKPSYLSTRQWTESRDFQLGMILDTYAAGLMKLDRLGEAETAFREAFALTKAENDEINTRYVECLVRLKKNDEAVNVSVQCIRNGKAGEDLLTQYKAAYSGLHGTEEGFDEAVAADRNYAKNEMRKKFMEERLDREAIDFNLKDLDGNFVRLSDQKGKVVVIDFWATWCGPCKASFPFLQTIYEKYKDNDRVRIFALDTWENEKGEKREELVKRFMTENKYTFPVLYDEDFVDKYGVTGIPTKFVVDREGKIQFKSIGFSGGQEMIDELTIQIEMLLSEEFYSSTR